MSVKDPKKNIEAIYPLSPMQEGMLFHSLFAPEEGLYFEQFSCLLRGELNVPAFIQAWEEVIRRHPILRTSFVWKRLDKMLQVVHREVEVPVTQQDWRALSSEDQEKRLQAYLQAERQRGFDLAKAPLIRLALMRSTEDAYHFIWCYHHALLDGWSQPLLFKEILALYESLSRDQPIRLESARPYRDYIGWLQKQDFQAAEKFWRQNLHGFTTPTDLTVNRPAAARPAKGKYIEKERRMSPEISKKVRALSREHQITVNTFVQGAWALLLSKYSGKSDVLFGITVSGRPAAIPGAERMIGLFINTLPLRVRIPSEQPVLSWLKDLQAHQVEVQRYDYCSLVKIQEWSEVTRGQQLFNSILVFENYPISAIEENRQTHLQISDVRVRERANYPLTVVAAFDTELFIKIGYDQREFDDATIERMLGHFETIFQGFVTHLEQPVRSLEILSPTERRLILQEWNNTKTSFPEEQCIHHLFAHTAESHPQDLALVFEGLSMTYQQLNQRANQLAHYLQKLGVGPESLVGLYMERSLELIIAIFGILKAGGAYLPLDTRWPRRRVDFVLNDANASILLTQKHLTPYLEASSCAVLSLDEEEIQAEIDRGATFEPQSEVTPNNLAYVIYTSGSTGYPKGVLLEHKGLVNLALAHVQGYKVKAGYRVLQFASIGFDASVSEIFATLVSGGTLVLARQEVLSSPTELANLLKSQAINMVTLPPSLLLAMDAVDLPDLKILVSAGEVCPWEVPRKWARGRRFLNGYGPTETTVGPTFFHVQGERKECATVPIGTPIANYQVFILNKDLQPVPIGVPGEIHIGGVGLARGYLNQEELTREKFISWAFEGGKPLRLYKTGDLGRYLPDGNIEFLGRLDFQVKVRGHRIELEEVEAAILRHPSVQAAAVKPSGGQADEAKLVAYVVPSSGQSLDLKDLRHSLKTFLPDYMIPSLFVPLPKIPLTKSGKVDREALPEPSGSVAESGRSYLPPRNPHEELLAGIYSEVLGVPRVGATDDFFDLGGHSLLVTRLVSRVRRVFQTEIQLRDVFDKPVVEELAEHIRQVSQRETEEDERPPILPVSRAGHLPLSYAQQRLWFLDQLVPGNAFYNLPVVLQLTGELHYQALEEALNEIVRRHEALRTTFVLQGEEPTQQIAAEVHIPIQITSLEKLAPEEREARAQELIINEVRKPFDLAQGPLLRAHILRLDDNEHIVLFIMHHIVSDGWSMAILVRELATLYPVFLEGKPSPLPELEIQYADFAAWERQWLKSENLARHQEYWKNQLAGSPALLNLPTDHPRPSVLSSKGAHLSFVLPVDLSQAIMDLCHKEGHTVFMVLLSAFMTLLYRYSGQTDINIGTAVANRNREEIEGLIGFFVNTLVLRGDLSGNPTFRQFMQQIRQVTLEAHSHQDLPFEMLVELMQPAREMSHTPLFQVMFTLDNAPAEKLELPGLTLKPIAAESGTSKFDLTLSMFAGEDQLAGNFEFSTDLFEPATIEKMALHFQVLLEGIVADPDRRVAHLPLLTQEETQQILVEWNQEALPFAGDRCFHELFEAQVDRQPEAVAVRFVTHASRGEVKTLTYQELDERANRLAQFLAIQGVGPEVLVGVCLDRSIELIVAILAVLKAGGAYLPLDPSYPRRRLGFMVKDAGVNLVITTSRLRGRLPGNHLHAIEIDKEWERIAQLPSEKPTSSVKPHNLAYVIYTSGSTGVPKGSLLPHYGLANIVAAQQHAFGLGPGDQVLQFSSISFDAATFDLAIALGLGASLCMGSQESLRPGPELLAFLKHQSINFVVLPPSAMLALPLETLPDLRILAVAGEACPAELVRRWASDRAFFNLYGPTECTIWSTYARCQEGNQAPPIGRPIPNTQVYVMDEYQQPVPVGVPGELYLGGVGVGRGYLNRPDLTAERFIPNPFSNSQGDRLYRTGDLVRYRQDGNLEFLGRVDHQVKVRGFRIELGEIEAILRKHPQIEEAVVILDQEAGVTPRLVAYVVPQAGTELTPDDLRNKLAHTLPEFMIPALFVLLEQMPLTPSGKIDRQALPKPKQQRPLAPADYVPPRNVLEEKLMEMWQKIIQVDKIGVHDNFFELGGDSIRGAVFINQLQKTLGESIMVAALFEAQTISTLAEYIASTYPEAAARLVRGQHPGDADVLGEEKTEEALESTDAILIPIKPEGSKPPLYCIHPAGGVVFPYYNLVPYVDKERPLYGIQNPSIFEDEPVFSSLEEMAELYVSVIQKHQPSGPYWLAGWSSGGLVAFEIAQQLIQGGEKVAYLGIIDFRAPLPHPSEMLAQHLARGARKGMHPPPGSRKKRWGFIRIPQGRGVMVPRSVVALKLLRIIKQPFIKIRQFFKEIWLILNMLQAALSYVRDGLYLKSTAALREGQEVQKAPTMITKARMYWNAIWHVLFLRKAEISEVVPPESHLSAYHLPAVRKVLQNVRQDAQLTFEYLPRVYPGQITLFRTKPTRPEEKSTMAFTLGWHRLAGGGIRVYEIPGNHVAIMKKPYVETFSQILNESLDEAVKE